MVLHYITESGIFGILLIINFIILIYLTYTLIKNNQIAVIIKTIVPVTVIFILFNSVVTTLLFKTTGYDAGLELIKDSWFILAPVLVSAIFANHINLNKKVEE